MMKNKVNSLIVAVLGVCFLSSAAFAQNDVISPADGAIVWNGTGFHDMEVNIINQTTEDLHMSCYKLTEPNNHDLTLNICLNGYCEMGLPQIGNLNTIAPLDTGMLRIHVTAANLGCMGIVKYYLYEFGDPFGGDTITYYINQGGNVGQGELAQDLALDIYPNPAISELNLNLNMTNQGPTQIDVLNIAGAKVLGLQVNGAGTQTVSLLDLKSGFYLVRVTTSDGKSVVRRFEKI